MVTATGSVPPAGVGGALWGSVRFGVPQAAGWGVGSQWGGLFVLWSVRGGGDASQWPGVSVRCPGVLLW